MMSNPIRRAPTWRDSAMTAILVAIANAALLIILALGTPSAAVPRPPKPMPGNNAGERFPAVTISGGQGIRVVVANVRIPDPGTSSAPCSLTVRFLDAAGGLVGNVQTVQLAPGAAKSVAVASANGPVRALVRLTDVADVGNLCAVRNLVEVFDMHTAATIFAVPGATCLGGAPCNTRLAR